MPTYYFSLRRDGRSFVDHEGVVLRDEDAARAYAGVVARELLQGRYAPPTRPWKIQVEDEGHKFLFEVLFATVDKTLDHLEPGLRKLIEKVSATIADTVEITRKSRLHRQAVAAARRRRPYLVVESGRHL
jgi:hypothetical protein